jgi:hypothetical protein
VEVSLLHSTNLSIIRCPVLLSLCLYHQVYRERIRKAVYRSGGQQPFFSQVAQHEAKAYAKALAKGEIWAVEQFICETWGKDCKTALAVSRAENGTRKCDRQGALNKNGTHDWGVFQINEIHLKKGYTLKDFTDCKKNIQIAHSIYKGSGWGAWSVYNNKKYLQHLTN